MRAYCWDVNSPCAAGGLVLPMEREGKAERLKADAGFFWKKR